MKTILRLLIFAFFSFFVVLTSSCTNSKKTLPSFDAVTLRHKTVKFTNVETGEVSIPKANIAKMDAIDKNGNPEFFTKDIAGSFSRKDSIAIKNLNGFCIRFNVPAIEKNDYLIIKAEIHMPKEITINGNVTTTLDASYRYDSKYSGRTEYIWFIFSDSNPSLKIDGRWNLTLFNRDRKLLDTSFDAIK